MRAEFENQDLSADVNSSQKLSGAKRKGDQSEQDSCSNKFRTTETSTARREQSIKQSFGIVDKRESSATSQNMSQLMKQVQSTYRMDFPPDFEQLWRFCCSMCPSCPKKALLDPLGFVLCGPFDLLDGKTITDPLLHCRYHLDPPEFQTVLKISSSSDQMHFGYFRDDPNKLPAFVASAKPVKDCVLRYSADNLLELVYKELNSRISKQSASNSVSSESLLLKLKEKLEVFVSKCDPVVSLNCREKNLKDRKRKSQGTTFHKLGISVHVKNDIGYRPIHHEDAALRKLMQKVAQCESQPDRVAAFGPLHEQITFVQFANDESDFGMGLELGLDFFLHGAECFHKAAAKLLPTAYKFLKRDLYAEIIEKHLANREKDQEKIDFSI